MLKTQSQVTVTAVGTVTFFFISESPVKISTLDAIKEKTITVTLVESVVLPIVPKPEKS